MFTINVIYGVAFYRFCIGEMAALKFSANITMMFREAKTLADRIVQAKHFGFKYIEIVLPYEESKESISQALKANSVQCSLINAWPGLSCT